MSLRVALVVFNLPERGTYFRAYQLARQLARRGHTCTLVYTAPQERRRFDVRLEERGRLALVAAPDLLPGSLRSGWDPWAALARTLLLRGARYDLVHAFECRPSVIAPALAAARGAGAPLVIDWCDWFGRGGSVEERTPGLARDALRPVETLFEERFRRCADATTVINTTLRQYAEKLGVLPESIRLIPNGCDVEWAGNPEPQAAARAALGLPAGAPIVGYAGAIFRRDAALMAAAFDRVRAARPEARLLVLGYTNIAVEDLVADPGAVIRTGPLPADELRRGLRACDLGWVPLCDSGANRGRWPLKVSTYMELGLPVVTTAVGDLGPFFARHRAGVAAPADPEGLADATLRLLDDPAARAALGAEGRRLAEGELSWARVADGLEALYREVAAG
jgi:glycosyltransferase involved in cell wall biosynthesis